MAQPQLLEILKAAQTSLLVASSRVVSFPQRLVIANGLALLSIKARMVGDCHAYMLAICNGTMLQKIINVAQLVR